MIIKDNFAKKKFAVYGLGITGISVINFLNRSKVRNYFTWDDDFKKRKKLNIKSSLNKFKNELRDSDYIVLSPGINLKKSKLNKQLKKNKSKIISDLDLFYMSNSTNKSIVVTGTNGKSTTCKIVEHLLNKNKIHSKLGGNIGRPILSLKLKKNSFIIIEASSFQLAYSKFVRPNYAILLNLTKDHLDWHNTMKHYSDSKFKIFNLQTRDSFAFISEKNLIKKFKKKGYLSKLKIVSDNSYNKIKNKLNNNYLKFGANNSNMPFAYILSKVLKIKKKNFLKSFNSFKGLPHRNEIILKNKYVTFINDSKSTSFEASKTTLTQNSNVYWIVGGQPKLGDKFFFGTIKKNIVKAYIIGKNTKFFTNKLQRNIKFKVSKNLKSALIQVIKDLKIGFKKKSVVLFSPAAASFDQYKNFNERGEHFKKLVKIYGNK